MASTYLTRTFGSETNRKTFTFSAWCKFSATESMLFNVGSDANNRSFLILTSDYIAIENRDSGTRNCQMNTSRLFRDYNAWYHIVLAVDTTQATSSDRVKLYVNGTQETSFSTETYPPQNQLWDINKASTHYIGRNAWTTGNPFNGSMSHIHFIDGTAYAPTVFGETDSTTGEWKINTSPSVTYGTNGFFILKDGNSVTDQSGNSNNFTVAGGTLTKTEDNPSNVFATLNPLSLMVGGTYTFENGNTTCQQDISRGTLSNLGMTSGKFYAESKFISTNTSTFITGICGINNTANQDPGYTATGYTYHQNGSKRNNNSNSSFGNTYATGDIIGIAVDLDNLKIYFSINGTWQNSGDPTSGANGTGAAFTITAPSLTPDGAYFFAFSDINDTSKASWNFGNGYFGTTAVSSAGTNASGIGIFEYDVPTGYTALSTKGLNL